MADIDPAELAKAAGLSGDAAKLFAETLQGLREVMADPGATASARATAGSRIFGLLGLNEAVKDSGKRHRFDDGIDPRLDSFLDRWDRVRSPEDVRTWHSEIAQLRDRLREFIETYREFCETKARAAAVGYKPAE